MVKHNRTLCAVLFFALAFIPIHGAFASSDTTTFTPAERAWIKSNPEIKLVINVGPSSINFWEGVEPSEPPEEQPGQQLNQIASGLPAGTSDKPLQPIEEGERKRFKGVAAEYLREIQNITGLVFTPVLLAHNNSNAAFEALANGEADLFPVVPAGQPLPEGVLLTGAYIQAPLVVVMSEKSQGYEKLYELYALRVAGEPSIRKNLHRIGLTVNLIQTSLVNGLLGVSTGTYDAFIGELSAISYELSKKPIAGIQIAGELPRSSHVVMAVSPRIQEFVPIFNKALTLISQDRKAAISEKWLTISYEKKRVIDGWFWTALIIGGFILAGLVGFLYYQRRLQQIQAVAGALDPSLLSVTIDHDIIITQVSEALCDITGHKARDLVGKLLSALGSTAEERSDVIDFLKQTLKKGNSWKGEFKILKKDGSTLWTEAVISPQRREGEGSDGYTVIYQDVSQKKHFEDLAIKDELTRLYNRRHFKSHAPKLLDLAKQENKIFAFILMDLDNFKNYNDLYGHPAGDKVLASIGDTLHSIFRRREDLVFRWGGEEFAAVALFLEAQDALATAEKIKQQVQDLNITHRANAPGIMTISIGLALAKPGDSSDIDSLYKKADSALYGAKQRGKNQIVRCKT